MNHLAQEIIKAVTTIPGGTIEEEVKHVEFTLREFNRKRREWIDANEDRIRAITDLKKRFRYVIERIAVSPNFTEKEHEIIVALPENAENIIELVDDVFPIEGVIIDYREETLWLTLPQSS